MSLRGSGYRHLTPGTTKRAGAGTLTAQATGGAAEDPLTNGLMITSVSTTYNGTEKAESHFFPSVGSCHSRLF